MRIIAQIYGIPGQDGEEYSMLILEGGEIAICQNDESPSIRSANISAIHAWMVKRGVRSMLQRMLQRKTSNV